MKYKALGFLLLVILPGTSRAQFDPPRFKPFANTPFDPRTLKDLDPTTPGTSGHAISNIFNHLPEELETFPNSDPNGTPMTGVTQRAVIQYDSSILFSYNVVNDTRDTVAFTTGSGSMAGKWYRLPPGGTWRVTFHPMQDHRTPIVVISQLGGGLRQFTIQNEVPYAFRVNPSTNQIENYYR